MSRRPRMTSADYLTIAVSPALIMTLIGSLVFFLIDVFYAGSHGGRVNYIFALFIFAAVLIGRISIEEGVERAGLFAIPLALATWFVLGGLINLAIIGFVWWWAHKLTWDCTLIDDQQDASGEGLLQASGLFQRRARKRDAAVSDGKGTPTAPRSTDRNVAGTDNRQRDRGKPATRRRGEEPVADEGSGAIERVDVTLPAGESPDDSDATRWWERFRRRRSRRHVPGLWVLYFSLGALPLFSLLQRTIPLGATDRRDFSFRMLVVYVASALGLLLSTSFLGVRRYLRQRRLQMPAPMAATWVAIGTTLILAVMILAALLPRPAAEVAVARLPFRLTSRDDLSASRRAPLRSDAAPDDQQVARDRVESYQPDAGDQKTANPRDHQSTGDEQNGTTRDTQRPNGEPQEDEPQGNQSQNDTSQDNPSQDDRSSGTSNRNASQNDTSQNDASQKDASQKDNDDQPEPEPRTRGADRDDRDDQRRAPGDSTGDDRSPQDGSRPDDRYTASQEGRQLDEPPEGGQQRGGRRDGSNEAPASAPSSPRSTPSPSRLSLELSAGTSILGAISKLLFYALLIVGIGYLLWRNREKIGPALRRLVQELRELWARLFGSRTATAGEEEPAAPTHRAPRFADFHDPFATGEASHMRPEAVVAYTLVAFQAWARDHGHPRRDDQTPRELVRRAVPANSPLADPAGLLIELHSRMAYGTGRVPAEQVGQLRQLWLDMRANPPQQPAEFVPVASGPAEGG